MSTHKLPSSNSTVSSNHHSLKNSHSQLGSSSKNVLKTSLHEQIQLALARMDALLKENFDMKRELVFERKKYLDLNQLYHDLCSNLMEGYNPLDPYLN